MSAPTVEVCPTCLRPTGHVEPHFDEEYCICGCCACEATAGCCCTKCACDGVTAHRRTRREEDEGLTEAEMIAERDLDEREADEAAALAWVKERP